MIYKGLLIIQLVWVSCMALSCSELTEREVFSCPSGSQKIVKIYDEEFTCPDGQLCNLYGLPASTSPPTSESTSTCNPCLPIKTICGDDVFKCEDNTLNSFTIGETPFTCPKDHICNKDRKDSCDPCIGYCNPNLWECNPDDETKVIIGGMTIPCNSGEICNKNKKPPCTACIARPTSDLYKYLKNIPEWNINNVL